MHFIEILAISANERLDKEVILYASEHQLQLLHLSHTDATGGGGGFAELLNKLYTKKSHCHLFCEKLMHQRTNEDQSCKKLNNVIQWMRFERPSQIITDQRFHRHSVAVYLRPKDVPVLLQLI